MKTLAYLFLFLLLNFGALGLGIVLMNNGPMEIWYLELAKAPWTPPNWVFGIAWTLIMICFSIYMAFLVKLGITKKLWTLYMAQLVFNISWNLFFFNLHWVFLGALNLIILLIIIISIFYRSKPVLGRKSVLIAPYFLWLLVANSLNIYILFNN